VALKGGQQIEEEPEASAFGSADIHRTVNVHDLDSNPPAANCAAARAKYTRRTTKPGRRARHVYSLEITRKQPQSLSPAHELHPPKPCETERSLTRFCPLRITTGDRAMFTIFLIWNVSSSERGHLAELRRYLAKEDGKQRKTSQGLKCQTTSTRHDKSTREFQRES
jgi:hypothetical protein